MLMRRRLLAAAAALPMASAHAQTRRAPELTGIASWVNTQAPLTLAGLRGKVVLVNFWTYSCINCRRTVAYLNRWQEDYGSFGLQVIGIHTPEFGFERMRHNVEDAVRSFGIRYPVGQDNDFGTWRAWSNRAWPAFYLLDRDGRIVLLREGEDHAYELETAIRGLLGLVASGTIRHEGDDPDLSRIGSAEMYFGAEHPTPQDPAQSPRLGEAAYRYPSADPPLNVYQLDGTWVREGESLRLGSGHGGLRLRFSAAKLHLVADAPTPATLTVRADEAAPRLIQIDRPTLYTLLDGETYGEHSLSFAADTSGLTLFSATFG